MNVLSKYRVIDKHERERIAEGKYFICDRHYSDEDIEYTSKYYKYFVGYAVLTDKKFEKG